MKNYMDGGEAIVEAFRNAGIDYVTSSPGSEWGPVWEALARQKVEGNDGPTYISCWHETLAVNLAAGYSIATGRPQAVLLHAGAGLLQGSLGIHGAQLAGVPLVIMSGESLSYGEDPEFDPGQQWMLNLSIVGGPQRLVEPIVKWASQATSPSTLYESVVRAIEMAQRTPAGPTYLSIPIENMMHEWTPPAKLRNAPPAPKSRPVDADIDRVAKLLVESRYPVITADSAGRDPDAYAALVDLAELLGIAVVENFSATSPNFPKDHPLHQGFDIQPHLPETDLVLSVCCRSPWYPAANGPASATVVAIDDNPHKSHMAYQSIHADVYLEGDVAASLGLLVDAVRALGVDTEQVAARTAKWEAAHGKRLDELRSAEAVASDKGPIDPVHLCAVLSEVMPDNAFYVDETTTHRRAIQGHVGWQGPQSYFRVPSGLGQGLGTALGIKLANPDRPVVSLIGDGAFLYNPVTQCLGLSMEADLPILIVVFNNRGYKAMKSNQLSYYPDGTGAQSDIYLGHPISGPDYATLLEPFGGFGRRVEDPGEIASAARECLAAVENGQTAILNVVLEG